MKQIEAKGSSVALATVQMKVGYRGKFDSCRVFLDIGSQISFVHPDVLSRLGIDYHLDFAMHHRHSSVQWTRYSMD